MPASRFYQDKFFEEGETITIEDDEFHHLKNVMRHEQGDCIEIINGKGSLGFANLVEIKKKCALALINKVSFFEKTHDFIILQGMPKLNKLEILLEKGTELGATEFHLFHADKSSTKIINEKLHRMNLKLTSALKQSGRYYLPQIKMIPPIPKWEPSFQNAYFGALNENAPLLYNLLSKKEDLQPYFFCCGPEAGFSEKEIELLNKKHFKGVSLHPNILRTETAPLAFLSLVYHHLLIHGHRTIVN